MMLGSIGNASYGHAQHRPPLENKGELKVREEPLLENDIRSVGFNFISHCCSLTTGSRAIAELHSGAVKNENESNNGETDNSVSSSVPALPAPRRKRLRSLK